MLKLLKKEYILAMHPTSLIFLSFSAMLAIPSYPYYVVFFYTGLAIFFTCLTGRENNDVYYTLSLPVPKKSIVGARLLYAVTLQLAQLAVAVPFAILRNTYPGIVNEAGMDANAAFFGLSFVLLGIFNYSFFTAYYKNVEKVGRAFVVSSVWVFLYILVAEVSAHAIPFVRDYLDTPAGVNIAPKLITLAAGIAVYALLTLLAYRRSAKSFEKQDI